MSSPDAFRSSPLRGPRSRQRSIHAEHESSSPGLPSMQEILQQKPLHPSIRSGSQAKPVPKGAVSAFTSAREHWKSVQAAADQDDSVVVIENHEESTEPVFKSKRTRKPAKKATAKAGAPSNHLDQEAEPWKKYIPSPKKDRPSNEEEVSHGEAVTIPRAETATKKATKKNTGVMSKHFSSGQEPLTTKPIKKKLQKDAVCKTDASEQELLHIDPNEPLELEQAIDRRADWTPPGPKQGHFDGSSSVTDETKGAVFKTLLTTYGCNDQAQREAVVAADGDSSFMKKRKLLEFVSPTRGSRSASPEKSPVKEKAPKKKKQPRTLTELATAAYRPQEEPPEPSGSLREYLTSETMGQKEADGKNATKAKPKARKAKPSKRKAAPPKPILLSPATALKESSKQDFVFGTSSQLVREHSPTMLRDLQTAIRDSTQVDVDVFGDPFKSDEIEAGELKHKLWGAGARNDHGQLFNAAIVNLVSSSPGALPVDNLADPFGYQKHNEAPESMDSEPSAEGESFPDLSDVPVQQGGTSASASNAVKPDSDVDMPPAADESFLNLSDILTAKPDADVDRRSSADASFANLSDILPTATKDTVITVDDDSSFSSSQISVSSDLQRRTETAAAASEPRKHAESTNTAPSSKPAEKDINQPNFDLYTDAQLSREITSYGFKPIKRRTAMISLLQQCWVSKHPSAPVGARSITTTASLGTQKAEANPKRPRGRPRKNSVSEPEAQEPPPSAQTQESPKRPRGRPRKDSTLARLDSPTKTAIPPPSGQTAQSPKRPGGRPRKEPASAARPPSTKAATKTAKKAAKTGKIVKPGMATVTEPKTPPRKSKVSKMPIEIPDSASEQDSEISDTPESSPEQTFSPSQDVDLSVSMDGEGEQSLLVDPDEEERKLFGRIKSAVTTAPRSTDPKNPSWHEKMLMYDPIVLEDLTAWLNSGHLTRVGYDSEVKPGDVKKWCESESVCCLWRVNLRGKERKRL